VVVVVGDLVHQNTTGVLNRHPLAAVGEAAACEGAQHAADAVDGLDRDRLVADDDVAAGRNGDASREGVLDAIAERPAGEVHGGGGAGVVEFDVLLAVVAGGGVVLDLVDDDLGARLCCDNNQ